MSNQGAPGEEERQQQPQQSAPTQFSKIRSSSISSATSNCSNFTSPNSIYNSTFSPTIPNDPSSSLTRNRSSSSLSMESSFSSSVSDKKTPSVKKP